MLRADPEFLRILLKYVKSTYLPEKRHNPKYPDTFTSGDLHFFAPAVADLSAAFTFERGARPANYFNTKEARSSYLLYFLIPNMLKVRWILEQQCLAEWFADESEVRVADIGCGPCTGLLAVAQYWNSYAPQQKLRLVAVDHNGPMLKDGKELLKQISTGPVIETYIANITTSDLRKKFGGQKFHILILANVLNELNDMKTRVKFARGLMDNYLEPNGRLIIVEPALQRATRDLMLLRDQIVTEQQAAHILAPCLQQTLCPMRANNPRDWCHTYINWERPQVIADLDMLIGNKKDYLKMSYMVLSVRGEPVEPQQRNIWRVVSAPMKSKGKLEILLCGQNGKLLRVTRLDKDRSAANAALDTATRGDIASYGDSPKCLKDSNFFVHTLNRKWQMSPSFIT